MPFKHFLTTSLNFERTHQLILQCLFNDPLFLRSATGIINEGYRVYLEPIRGLFDIGIYSEDDEPLCLIELKMWSGLSSPQLKRQSDYLADQSCLAMHILLGTSNLQFHRDDDYDDIVEQTGNKSCKIGYAELIKILSGFIQISGPADPITIIAKDYRDALTDQFERLDKAWLNAGENLHFRSYSTYSRIRKYLLDESLYIYTLNNGGGAAHILNDDHSWSEFDYKGHGFKIYQEMLNLEFMIRIEKYDAPNWLQAQLKDDFIKYLEDNDPFHLPWQYHSRTSKYHKIAIYSPEFRTEDDCKNMAELFKVMNPLIKDFVRKIKD
jgi:hypothetical protein